MTKKNGFCCVLRVKIEIAPLQAQDWGKLIKAGTLNFTGWHLSRIEVLATIKEWQIGVKLTWYLWRKGGDTKILPMGSQCNVLGVVWCYIRVHFKGSNHHKENYRITTFLLVLF